MQKILVSVLSLLFVFCVPLHIYDATTNIDHHAMSHSKDACALTIIDEQFAHFHEMTSALLATLLILAWSVFALWYQHQSRNLHTATLSWVPIEFFETYLSHKKGILYWLKLQTTSPPYAYCSNLY